MLDVAGLRFGWPPGREACLDIASFSVMRGEAVFLHGPSGCGKSTLLSLMAGVLLPQAGHVRLLGTDWRALRPSARDRFRVDHVGYLFQQFNLLPYLSVLDNVLLPCRFSPLRQARAARHAGSARSAAERWLHDMDLPPSLWRRRADTLSVGQQQRVAAARTLVGQPELVVADEPTSALDEARRDGFLDKLLSACRSANSALVLVSHDQRIAARFDRHVALPVINRAAPAGEDMA